MTEPVPSDSAGTLCWRDLRTEAARAVAASLGGDRRQEARWLVERVSGYDPAELVVNDLELVSVRSVAFFDQLLARRCAGEPLQYVLGRWSFRSLELIVNPGVLIPRPETEMVAGLAVEAVITARSRLRSGQNRPDIPVPVVAVDLGTGSGAIGLSIAHEVPGTAVWATDNSASALSTARANLAGLGRNAVSVTMVQGSWFDALPEKLRGHIDVLVSNPPYVATSLKHTLPVDVLDHEPHEALFSGPDGTADLEHIIGHAPEWLASEAVLILEMSPEQTGWASEQMASAGLEDIRVHMDLTGRARAVAGRMPI